MKGRKVAVLLSYKCSTLPVAKHDVCVWVMLPQRRDRSDARCRTGNRKVLIENYSTIRYLLDLGMGAPLAGRRPRRKESGCGSVGRAFLFRGGNSGFRRPKFIAWVPVRDGNPSYKQHYVHLQQGSLMIPYGQGSSPIL